jgi:hypothetical protein
MDRRVPVVAGVALIAVGFLALLLTVFLPLFGLPIGLFWPFRFALRLWPLLVIGAGLLFVIPPLLVRGRPGLGGLFIPGMPVLATGCILLFASTFDLWSAWAWLWPLEVLSVALGFVFAGLYMGVIWLLIPAIIIGLNGLLFQFCAITGLWGIWAVAWNIEPLSVGLALLVVGAHERASGLVTAGLILCGVAGFGFVGMLFILGRGWVFRLMSALLLLAAGLGLLVWGLAGRSLRLHTTHSGESNTQ